MAPGKKKKPNAVRNIINREEARRRRIRESLTSQGSDQCQHKVEGGVCEKCGLIFDDSDIVPDVQFASGPNGTVVRVGQQVGADQAVRGPTFNPFVSFDPFRNLHGGRNQAREKTLREVRDRLKQFCMQLGLGESITDAAFGAYKFATQNTIGNSFAQGRTRDNVAAVCLYAACRRSDRPNRVMLIDLADIVKTDVFKLGRDFKAFCKKFPHLAVKDSEAGQPVFMEDLIFRFAVRLEFLHDTEMVALSAVRIASRMRDDFISTGRRPAGICGAALIMAARAHNYRRTVREVVYIAKVTMATIQERMNEFARTASAMMSIDEFHNKDFLKTSHDPPAFYKQTKEWQEAHPKRANKRKLSATLDAGNEDNQGQNRRHASSGPESASSSSPSPPPPPPPPPPPATSSQSTPPSPLSSTSQPNLSTNKDKDGFVIPPPPVRGHALASDAHTSSSIIAGVTADEETNDSLLRPLVQEYRGAMSGLESGESVLDPTSELALALAQGIVVPGQKKRTKSPQDDRGKGKGAEENGKVDGGKKMDAGKGRGRAPLHPLVINESWENDEEALEEEVMGHLEDPSVIGASEEVAKEEKARAEAEKARAAARAKLLSGPRTTTHTGTGSSSSSNNDDNNNNNNSNNDNNNTTTTNNNENTNNPAPLIMDEPKKDPLDDPEIREDEFLDDPEVKYCKLGEADVRAKECIWVNENKDWMRKKQQEIFDAKMERRNGITKKRGRTGGRKKETVKPAATAADAAVNMLRKSCVSTRIDYDKLRAMFDKGKPRGPGSTYALTATGASDVTQRDTEAGEEGEEVEEEEAAGDSMAASVAPSVAPSVAGSDYGGAQEVKDGGGAGEDEYGEYEGGGEEGLDEYGGDEYDEY